MEKTKEVLILEETIRVLRVENKHLKMRIQQNNALKEKEREDWINKQESNYHEINDKYELIRIKLKKLYKSM